MTVIRTETGSVYYVRQEGDHWYLSADNISSERSKELRGEWPIHAPPVWPPRIGEPLQLISEYYDRPDHIDRMPGGGKLTSRVVEVYT